MLVSRLEQDKYKIFRLSHFMLELGKSYNFA